MLSHEEIAELMRLEAAASPGPWDDIVGDRTSPSGGGVYLGRTLEWPAVWCYGSKRMANILFVQTIRNATPELLAMANELHEAQAEILRLQKLTEELAARCAGQAELIAARARQMIHTSPANERDTMRNILTVLLLATSLHADGVPLICPVTGLPILNVTQADADAARADANAKAGGVSTRYGAATNQFAASNTRATALLARLDTACNNNDPVLSLYPRFTITGALTAARGAS